MKVIAILFAVIVAAGSAFVLPNTFRTTQRVHTCSTVLAASPEEIQALATSCLEEGCSVEMVDDLVASLKVRRSGLILQLATVDDLLRQLEGVQGGANQDAISDIIKSIAVLFSKSDNDYPAMARPSGYSGDTHRGIKDAWDYNMTK